MDYDAAATAAHAKLAAEQAAHAALAAERAAAETARLQTAFATSNGGTGRRERSGGGGGSPSSTPIATQASGHTAPQASGHAAMQASSHVAPPASEAQVQSASESQVQAAAPRAGTGLGMCCSSGHTLVVGRVSAPLFCDGCAAALRDGDLAFSCASCDHDRCPKCAQASGESGGAVADGLTQSDDVHRECGFDATAAPSRPGTSDAKGQDRGVVVPQSEPQAATTTSDAATPPSNGGHGAPLLSRAAQDREVAALIRGNSSIFSDMDALRLRASTPDGMVSMPSLGVLDVSDTMQVDAPMKQAAAGSTVTSGLPEAADVGRRLAVYWDEEGEWFPGVLRAIEAGHDDGKDTGDYHVVYDDGDDQWEPLGSRTRFRWTSERSVSGVSAPASSRSRAASAAKTAKAAKPRKQAAKPPASAKLQLDAVARELPEAADVGRRLAVYWEEEGEWFPGVLRAIEAGHDDGKDTGDYHVVYDDGDDQWEPLGSRTRFRWTSERAARAVEWHQQSTAGASISTSTVRPADMAASPPQGGASSRPNCKRMLSEKSHLAALPDAKHAFADDADLDEPR